MIPNGNFDEPEHGLPMRYWTILMFSHGGHTAHHEVSDAVVDKVEQRALDGMA